MTTATAPAAYTELVDRLRDIADLGGVMGLLGWDEQVMMPPKAAETRGRQLAGMSTILHGKRTDKHIGELLANLAGNPNLDTEQQAVVREAKRDYERATKVPPGLVAEVAKHRSEAYHVWTKARADNDFKTFAPYLEKNIGYSRQITDHRGATEDTRYDMLLDDFDPGATEAATAELFGALRPKQTELLKKIVGAPKQPRVDFIARNWPIDPQRDFGRALITSIGYDFDGGRQDISIHPFCGGTGPGDVRITTRFREDDPLDSLMGMLHEAGHALYEQGLPHAHHGTALSEACGMAVHESQSRMWENNVGRSREFWSWAWPQLRERFPAQSEGVSEAEWYHAVNEVKPGLIRVDADEVSYNLHVVIRFEIERMLLRKQLPVADLPAEWNRLYKEYLGVDVPTDTLGCLQDVHWAGGMFGYFPSYAVGNLYAAQLFEAALKAHPDLPQQFARGEFKTLLTWLRENVHAHGTLWRPAELLERATGTKPTPEPFLRYIESKYFPLFGV